ncbi:MAG TPA: NAD-dependent epimerase/dehydratase family protein [Polyangiaceae bacterium]
MRCRVLITGGAGFIGSHLVDELLSHDYEVRVLDSLVPQVHGQERKKPAYLDARAEFVQGDVRDARAVRRALERVDAVVHLAAAVGVGQSMYQIREYTETNNVGTAVLLEELQRAKVRRLVVASSMSVYGEGRYRDGDVPYDTAERTLEDLKGQQWDPRGPQGRPLTPAPTPEEKSPRLTSVYALSKYDQERMCLMVGRAYGIPTVALRFFNTYGPRQALSNPYTGVLAIFASRLLNGNRPLVFEDGEQRRDFVSVFDVARACRLALESETARDCALNVGSGRSITIVEVARRLAEILGKGTLFPEITGQHRVGDIRHCFADVSRAKELLGYTPCIELEQGLFRLGHWLRAEKAVDRSELARRELEVRGLTV